MSNNPPRVYRRVAKNVVMRMSINEAALLLRLRQFDHGSAILKIHKNLGEPYRIEITASELLKLDDVYNSSDVEVL